MGLFRSGRGGPTQGELAIRGLMVVGVIVGLLGLMTLSLKGAFSGTSQVATKLDTAGGSIASGADVKIRGLVVGKVSAVSGGAGEVRLELAMDRASLKRIPADVQARVLPATVFGTSFIDLVTPGKAPDRIAAPLDGGPTLKAGAVIPQDKSTPTLELQQALDSIDELVKALGPAKLASALGSLAEALDGQGTKIGKTIDLADNYLTALGPDFPLVAEDIRLLATNVETLRDTSPELLSAVQDALFVGQHLVEKQAQFTSLLTGSGALVSDLDSLISKNQAKFIATIRQAAVVTDAVFDQRLGVRTSMLGVYSVASQLASITEGQWLRVDGAVVDNNYSRYTRADCPRYQGRAGTNCSGAGRAAVGRLVAGRLLDDTNTGSTR